MCWPMMATESLAKDVGWIDGVVAGTVGVAEPLGGPQCSLNSSEEGMTIGIIWLQRKDSSRAVADCVPVQLDEGFIRLI